MPARQPPRAIVLGASGHIGNAVVRELLGRGFEVTAACRRPAGAANLEGLPVRLAAGDAEAPGQLDVWVAGHDLVADAAAPYPLYLASGSGRPVAARDSSVDRAEWPRTERREPRRAREARSSTARRPPGQVPEGPDASDSRPDPLERAVRRTEALLDAVRRHGTRLVLVSSFTTRLRHRGLAAQAARELRGLHPYFAVKERIEQRVLAAAEEGLPAAVINPTLCLGPWDLKPRELCFIPRLVAGETPVALDHTVNVVDVRDVAVGLAAAVEAERWGEPVLIAGHNLALSALDRWVCDLAGARPPRWRLPASLAALPAWGAEALLARTGGGRSPWPALAVMLVSEHRWLAPSRAQTELGVHPRPLSRTLADTLAWYRRIGYC